MPDRSVWLTGTVGRHRKIRHVLDARPHSTVPPDHRAVAAQLAAEVGIRRSAVAQWERAAGTSPSVGHLAATIAFANELMNEPGNVGYDEAGNLVRTLGGDKVEIIEPAAVDDLMTTTRFVCG